MHFDPDNNVIKLCEQGMSLEAEEKFIAAHYIARHQDSYGKMIRSGIHNGLERVTTVQP